MDVWDREVQGVKLAADEVQVLPVIKGAVDRIYRSAATALIEAFGRYCSYCETPISELVQVEHLLPKSQYPTFAVDPDNLLLACGPCNRRKGDTPTRKDASPWVISPNPTPSDYRQAIRNHHYCWPDTRPRPTWLPLLFEYRDAAGAWRDVNPPAAAVDPGMVVRSAPHVRPVRADVPAAGVSNVEVRVRYRDSGPGAAPRGVETVDLCKLNTVGPGTNDDRVGHRTSVWLRAVACWHDEVPDPPVLPTTLDATFVELAGLSGCFSVWYTTGELVATGLGGLFATVAADWFRGTATNRLP